MRFMNKPGSYAICICFYKTQFGQKRRRIMRPQGQKPVTHAVIKRGSTFGILVRIISCDPVELNGRIKSWERTKQSLPRLNGLLHKTEGSVCD